MCYQSCKLFKERSDLGHNKSAIDLSNANPARGHKNNTKMYEGQVPAEKRPLVPESRMASSDGTDILYLRTAEMTRLTGVKAVELPILVTGTVWRGLSVEEGGGGAVIVLLCVFFPSILEIKFVGRTSRGHTGGRSHRISHPPSFCGACLNFSRKKDSAIPFPRRP